MEVHCPNCRGKIVLDGAPLPDILRCGECGSTFVRDQATVAFVPDGADHEVTYVPGGRRTSSSGLSEFGDFEIIEEIARGGMGVVYKARQKSLNRIVALKLILSGELADADDVARFRSEAEAAAQLDHPGIVPVYEVGEQDGRHYLSMSYVDGESLAEQLAEGPLPPKRAAEVIKLTAEAVQYAHEHGVIHRDLKPRNILLDQTGHPRVSDFGLAKNLLTDSALTATGKALGTPAYMPPEQARAAATGPLVDVYSLGATLYCLLTGRPPFQAATSHETMLQVVEREPISPRLLNTTIPRDLETICLKCLRKQPAKRYQSASALSQDLGRWLNREPILARPVRRLEKAWLWCRRRPGVAGSIAAILSAACVVTGLMLIERKRNLDERIETAVAAMGTADGKAVPFGIMNLERFPPELVLDALQEQFESPTKDRKLGLAYALAHYDDVRVDILVPQVQSAARDEVDNLAAALGHSRAESISALEAAAQIATEKQDWRHKARLALLALYLDAPSLASEMCELRPDPIQRTWFIEECSDWRSDLARLAELAADSDDVPLRSAIMLAAGGAPEADISVGDRERWKPVLSDWYRVEADTPTHSSAGWTLRKFQLELPEIQPSPQPIGSRNWHVNSVGMTMLLIPAGSFVRSAERAGDDAIEQTVMLSRFLLADSEVTREQFQRFMDDPDADKPQEWQGAAIETSPTEQHPVQGVNWYDAVQFCNWLSLREGLTPCYERTGDKETTVNNNEYDAWRLVPEANGYRLPTEAEWEYASRAGTSSVFCCGDDDSLLDRYAVYRADRTEQPASRLPNGWGLFDMHGNVWEWCHDRYGRFGSETPLSNPNGPSDGVLRVLRGGSFFTYAPDARSAYRTSSNPDYRAADGGFRVVRTYH